MQQIRTKNGKEYYVNIEAGEFEIPQLFLESPLFLPESRKKKDQIEIGDSDEERRYQDVEHDVSLFKGLETMTINGPQLNLLRDYPVFHYIFSQIDNFSEHNGKLIFSASKLIKTCWPRHKVNGKPVKMRQSLRNELRVVLLKLNKCQISYTLNDDSWGAITLISDFHYNPQSDDCTIHISPKLQNLAQLAKKQKSSLTIFLSINSQAGRFAYLTYVSNNWKTNTKKASVNQFTLSVPAILKSFGKELLLTDKELTDLEEKRSKHGLKLVNCSNEKEELTYKRNNIRLFKLGLKELQEKEIIHSFEHIEQSCEIDGKIKIVRSIEKRSQ
ncbi:hypothetical protein L2755_20325 [Shewanella abyssi]|uniref:hypothetical protein n=1 Tax=Shewanella abyssi TaxID=311789 RepID=UPI00200C9F5B|nr:hypothetical protein [Shewanella abyssi]MCL1051948.1 hypothetical protein [Shewanella abyssi]